MKQGMVLLWLTTIIPQAKPASCTQLIRCSRKSATTPQLLYLYSCLGLMSIGAGGIRSSSMAFGADQLDRKHNPKNAGVLRAFFSWYYVSCTVSVLIALSCVVYIQDNLGWKIGYGVPVVLMLFSAISFFLASPFYVKVKANKSLLTGFAQVIVASYKNRDIQLLSLDAKEMYYHTKWSITKPSENLRYVCIIFDTMGLKTYFIIIKDLHAYNYMSMSLIVILYIHACIYIDKEQGYGADGP